MPCRTRLPALKAALTGGSAIVATSYGGSLFTAFPGSPLRAGRALQSGSVAVDVAAAHDSPGVSQQAKATVALAAAALAVSGSVRMARRRSAARGARSSRLVAAAAAAGDPITPDSFVGVCEQTGVTLSRYLLELQKRDIIDKDLVSVFNSIREASKVIAKLVGTAPLQQAELLGLQGEINVQGEDQKKLDVITNDVFKNALRYTGKLGTLASEEEDAPVIGTSGSTDLPVLSDTFSETGKYVCVFDPLDGSSNVDAGIPVGTIFGVFKEPDEDVCKLPEDMSSLTAEQAQCLAGTLQPGNAMVASGYVLYSASTELVLTTGRGVVGFTLDTTIGEFILTRPSIRIPTRGKIYSLNQANIAQWDAPMIEYVKDIRAGKGETGKKYSLRYIGSMVGDIHRTLLYGGIFAYPADKKNQDGKLRLLYEGAPMSMIMEQAGGKAITGFGSVMEIQPSKVHQRVPVILGSAEDVDECQKYWLKSTDAALRERESKRHPQLAAA